MKKIKKYYAEPTNPFQSRLNNYSSLKTTSNEQPVYDRSAYYKAALGTLIPLAAMNFAPIQLDAQCNTNFGTAYCSPPVMTSSTQTTTTFGGTPPASGTKRINYFSMVSFSSTFYVDIDGDGTNDLSIMYSKFRGPASEMIFYPGMSSSVFDMRTTRFSVNGLGGVEVAFANTATASGFSINKAVDLPANYTVSNAPSFGGYGVFYAKFETYFKMATGMTTNNSGTLGDFPPAPTTGYIGLKKGSNYGWLEVTVAAGKVTILSGGLGQAGSTPKTGDCPSLAALPVELVSFEAQAKNEQIYLYWQTASETNNEGFEIQRSVDGSTFRKIGWVEGYGNSSDVLKYQFTDREAQPNQLYYYRLKQLDFDGKFEFSKTVTAKVKNENVVVVNDILPNPSSARQVTLPVFMPEEGMVEYEIFNSVGAIVKEDSTTLEKGDNNLRMELQSLSAGQYFVKIQIDGQSFYKKLIIQ